MLRFTPNQIREMTINEFSLAVDGYLESKGIKTNKMTWNDVEDMMEEYNIPERSGSIREKGK